MLFKVKDKVHPYVYGALAGGCLLGFIFASIIYVVILWAFGFKPVEEANNKYNDTALRGCEETLTDIHNDYWDCRDDLGRTEDKLKQCLHTQFRLLNSGAGYEEDTDSSN